jgi:hypothetical protein
MLANKTSHSTSATAVALDAVLLTIIYDTRAPRRGFNVSILITVIVVVVSHLYLDYFLFR